MQALLVLALGPAAAILWWVYTRDRHDPEPQSLVAATVGLVALWVISAFMIELLGSAAGILPDVPEGETLPLAVAFVAAFYVGFVEEIGKLVAILILPYRRAVFDQRMDGIVYGVAASLGFAAVENVLYVLMSLVNNPLAAYLTGVARAVTAVPGHAVYGILMGAWVGLAKVNPARRHELILTGFMVAVLAHTLYDAVLFTRTSLAYAVIPILIGLIAAALCAIRRARTGDETRAQRFWGWRARVDEAADRHLRS